MESDRQIIKFGLFANILNSSNDTKIVSNLSDTNINKNEILVNNINNSFEKTLPQCDYSLLFSHLPITLQFGQFRYLTQYFTHSNLQKTILESTTQISTVSVLQAQYQQQSAYKLCFAIVALIFGLFYSLIGYRFLKLSTFIIGFSLGSSIIYLILNEQKQLTLVENLIISLSIGVLFAFVSLLVQYIGLFLLGITSSVSIVTCALILIDLFYINKSAWLCIGLLFICATIVASFTLKFQKSLTILNTSSIGCGLLLISIDFFVENNLLIDYIYELYKVNGNSFNIHERQNALLKSSSDFLTSKLPFTTIPTTTKSTTKLSSLLFKSSKLYANNASTENSNTNGALALFLHLYSSAHARLCWYTWAIFGSYFILLFISIMIQFLLTGKNYDHRNSWQKLIKGSRKKKSANLEKIRLKSHLSEPSGSSNGLNHHHHHHHRRLSSNQSHQSSSLNNFNSLSRNTDLDNMTNQIDTLLLAESGENLSDCNNNKRMIRLTTVTSSNDRKDAEIILDSNCKNKSHNRRSLDNENNCNPNSRLQEQNSDKVTPKNKIKNELTRNSFKTSSKSESQQNNKENVTSILSTASSSSSASSTCQLLPLKQLNSIESSAIIDPSAPPIPSQPTAPQAQAIAGALLIPPPVPTSLPPNKSSINNTLTSTSLISNTFVSNNSNSPMAPLLQIHSNNISKIKHNRQSVNTKENLKEISTNDKFRYFYQVRRNNGDVLSQDFMNNIMQTKLSSNSNLIKNPNSVNTCENYKKIINTNSPKTQRSSSLNTSDKKKTSKSNSNKKL